MRRRVILSVMIVILLNAALVPAPLAAQDSGPYVPQMTLGRGFVRSVAWSPDGKIVAVGGALGIWLYTPDLEDIGLLTGHTKAVYGLAFSPDSTKIASASHDQTVRVWDVAAQTELMMLEGHTDLVVTVAWSPDGRTLASGGYDGTVRLWDAATGAALGLLSDRMGFVQFIAWSQDGAQIAAANRSGQIFIWDVQDQTLLTTLDSDNQLPVWMAWNADGAISVFWNNRVMGKLEVWDAAAGELLQTAPSLVTDAVSWSPDPPGRAALIRWDHTVQIWDSQANSLLTSRLEHVDWITAISWNDSGSQITGAGSDGFLRTWDASTGALLDVTMGTLAPGPNPSDSPAGSRRAILDTQGVVRVLDVATGAPVAELPGLANAVAWSPDGARLAVALRNGTIKIWGEA